MARRNRRDDRDDTSIPSLEELVRPSVYRAPRVSPVRYIVVSRPPDLYSVEDGRSYHPLFENRPAVLLGGQPSRLTVSEQPTRAARAVQSVDRFGQRIRTRFQSPEVIGAVPPGVAFREPNKVIECIRRKDRREVLHALKRTRKGGGGSRRRDWRSEIKC